MMNKQFAPWNIARLLGAFVPLTLASLTALPASAQYYDDNYVPGVGNVERDEWYDPSDWFDGNELETEDIYGESGDYEYDYNYGTNEYVIDERDDELYGDDYGYGYDDDTYYDGYYEGYYDGYYDNFYTNDWYEDEGDFDTWYDEY